MKEVKSIQRYKCDFCKKRGIKRVMNFHEKTCYRNPNRICFMCENTGTVSAGDDYNTPVTCPVCEGIDEEKLKRIEEYEKTGKIDYVELEKARELNNQETPF